MNKNKKDQKSAATAATTYGYIVRGINWQACLNFLLLFITFEIAVLSIERAHWISPQPSLTLTLVLAMLVTLLLSRTRLHSAFIHIIITIAGLLLATGQVQSLLSPLDFMARLSQATAGLLNAGNGRLLFAGFLVLMTWFFSYAATWFLLRRHNPWVGISLSALVLLVNLSNLTDGYYYFLLLYFVAGVLFIAHTRVLRKPDPSGSVRRGWMLAGAVLVAMAVLAGGFARVTPEVRIPQVQNFLATRMLWKQNVEESRLNVFSSIPSKQEISTSSGNREQPFGEGWHNGENISFIIKSERPSYWRVQVYDIYTPGGWENSPVSDQLLGEKTLWNEALSPSDPAVMTYTVETNLKTDIVLLGGTFISADNPSLVQVGAGDIVSIRTPRLFRPGEKYSISSRYVTASSAGLSSRSGSYPDDILQFFLQLPEGFPKKIRDLSKQLTARAATPYDKVLAINRYLAKIPYSDKIKTPSPGVDPVENFLFDAKTGFCLYYASAMAVMLRSVDVPSRLAVGYLPGSPGENEGEYILRDSDYHAWPQVYFNGYGWIDIEATPGGEGSGVEIETPWVSGEAIAQLPQWDIWESYLLEQPEYPEAEPPAGGPPSSDNNYGAFFFADELATALTVTFTGILILLMLAAPFIIFRHSFFRWLWYVDRDSLASVVYDKMCNLAARINLAPGAQQTPLEFAAALADRFPEQADAFNHVARRYMENKFGKRGRLGLFDEAELLKARCIAFGALLGRLGMSGLLKRVRHR